ncbi:metallophosphoesterase [Robertmurraya massiliosenegalensis]|uniref:metallophosphoesterase n=1 Tax=Robertmurraya massiliosenegalensis TaxID=1287657 RepID=UPI000301AD7B|nr:metallophosphoesterase [Robertmurraya massiliosenegalensis]
MVYILAISILSFGVALITYMYKLAHSDHVLYQEITFPNFPDSLGEVKLFFISDLHRRVISEEIVKEVKGKVDIVIIGGDLLEKRVPIERVERNIKLLTEIGPTYFVWGNNDYEINPRLIDGLLLKYGVKILDNTAVSFESEEGERFVLLGTDDISRERDRLDLALQDSGKGGFKVLISHDPKIQHQLKEEDHISLVLSGHTHGGQIRIFGIGPYEIGKLKRLGETTILVSNGYGTTSLPLRLGASPETHVITLKKGNEE